MPEEKKLSPKELKAKKKAAIEAESKKRAEEVVEKKAISSAELRGIRKADLKAASKKAASK